MTEPSSGPGELTGNPNVLIEIEALPIVDVALYNCLKNANLATVAQLASVEKKQTKYLYYNSHHVKNVGPKRIEQLEKILAPLGVRWGMIEQSFIKGGQTEQQLRKIFEIPEGIPVPSYEEATKNFKLEPVTALDHSEANSLSVVLRLPAIFATAIESDKALDAQIRRILLEIANDLIAQDIPRQVKQIQAGEVSQSQAAVMPERIIAGTAEGKGFEFSWRLPPLFAVAASDTLLLGRITANFELKAFAIIRDHVKQKADEYAPSTQ